MDWLSIFLAVFQKGNEYRSRIDVLRTEALRMTAEAAAEVGQCSDILNQATLRLRNKCQMLAPENSEIWRIIEKALLIICRDIDQAYEILFKCQGAIQGADGYKMKKVMLTVTASHANSKRLVPWTKGLVEHYDAMLDNAHRLPA